MSRNPILLIVSVLFIVVSLAACGTSPEPTADPACDSFPGMPDRPCDPADTERSNYREDSPDAIGATGHPQLLVFHLSKLPEGTTGSGCIACTKMRPTVHQLEAEYWERIDFVYLERSDPEVKPLLMDYGIAGSMSTISLELILVDNSGEMLLRFYEGANQNRNGAKAPEIDYYRLLLDRQLEKLADS
jgi:hypothetical protein